MPILAALTLLPALCFAQFDGVDTSNLRLKRKAAAAAAKDPDYASLTEAEKRVVIDKVAEKLRAIKAYNRKHWLTSHESLGKVDIKVTVSDTDLKTLYEKRPELKKKLVLRQEEERTETKKEVPGEAKPGGFTIEDVAGEPFHGLFADNEWELKEGDANCDAGRLLAQVDRAIALAGDKGWISGLTVTASASTLRNTGKAANLSHLELSQKRAEAARDFILKYLRGKKIELASDRITLDYTGENGDGTSGPSGPYPNDTKNDRPPYTDLSDYGQDKYVDAVIQVSIPKEEPPTETPPQETTDEKVDSEVITLTVGIQSKDRWWDISWPHFTTKTRVRKSKPGECPRW